MSASAAQEKSAKTAITVKQAGANLGAEISGIDLADPVDAGAFAQIHDAFVAHELIIFHGQDITSEQMIAFGELFGELTVHPFSPNFEDRPELIVFDNKADNPPVMTDVWHSDETFRAEPPLGTVLRALVVPEIGGDTMFASMTAAYEGLSDRTQDFISGLEAVHDFKPFRQLFADDEDGRRHLRQYEDEYPPVVHPVVRVHPVSKKKAIFVNPQFTLRIKGMDERESRALLELLFHQAEIPEYQFRHRWRPDTLVVWDNRSTQHYAIHDYYPQRRSLERVTVKGDRPVGDSIADPATIRRPKFVPVEGAGADAHGGHRPRRNFERDPAAANR